LYFPGPHQARSGVEEITVKAGGKAGLESDLHFSSAFRPLPSRSGFRDDATRRPRLAVTACHCSWQPACAAAAHGLRKGGAGAPFVLRAALAVRGTPLPLIVPTQRVLARGRDGGHGNGAAAARAVWRRPAPRQRRAVLPAVLELHELQRWGWPPWGLRLLQQLLGARLVLRLIGRVVRLSAELGATSTTAATSTRCELPGLVGAVVRLLRRVWRWRNTAPPVFCHAGSI
jgi:hypothetical protein